MLSLYTYTFLAPVEEVLICLLKLFYKDICNFPMNIYLLLVLPFGGYCCRLCPLNNPQKKDITRIETG
jgi:hypothetical protein